uniref:Uncharacterized protein n=1 Tax=Anguilla anguilla TaxID=7936 RepID=A0A0E9QTP2_ANGAN
MHPGPLVRWAVLLPSRICRRFR